MGYTKPFPGSASFEPQDPKSESTDEEGITASCEDCAHSDVCIILDAIFRASPNGGVRLAECVHFSKG